MGFLRAYRLRASQDVLTRVPPEMIKRVTKGAKTDRFALSISQSRPCARKHAYFYEIDGLPALNTVTAFANSAVNALCALLERVAYHEIGGVFVEPHEPRMGIVNARLKPFWNAVKHLLPHATPVDLDDYVETTYRGRKREVYRRAAEQRKTRGLMRKDAYLESFLKWEKIMQVSIPETGNLKRQVPRLIQPRSPVFNVSLGRYLHTIEHSVYRSIDLAFHGVEAPTVMKGLNALQQGQIFHEAWTRFRRPVAIGIDASRFDQHISAPLLRWEHRVYHKIFGNDSELQELLSRQLENCGFLRSEGECFKYRCRGGRCSGDMNTALGNVIIACASVYSWLHGHGLHKKVRVLDAGDDCMLIGEKDDLLPIVPTLQPWFDDIGLIMKVEPPVDTLERVSFCQTQPVYDGRSYRMVRDPWCSLTKDQCIIHQKYWDSPKDALASIALCGLSLTGGLPVLQEYYRALLPDDGYRPSRDYAPLQESGFYQLSIGMHEKHRPVSDEARVSFWLAFGILPDLQIELENHYRSVRVDPHAPVLHGEVERVDLGIGSW